MTLSDTAARLLRILYEADGWITKSDALVSMRANQNRNSFDSAVNELLAAGLANVGRGRGGRIHITDEGTDHFLTEVDEVGSLGALGAEHDIYPHLLDYLQADSSSEELSPRLVVPTFRCKMRRGQWSNPDALLVEEEYFPLLNVRRQVLTSFEVKSWYDWSVKGAFEAAAHAAIAHRAYLVLEWAKDLEFDPRRFDRWAERLLTECGRLSVGLMTIQPRDPVRVRTHLSAEYREPQYPEAERSLRYFLEKTELQTEYESRFAAGRGRP